MIRGSWFVVREDCGGDGTGGRKPEDFAAPAEGDALGEGERGPDSGETAGACPHHDAVHALEVELLGPIPAPALSRRPLDIHRLHFISRPST